MTITHGAIFCLAATVTLLATGCTFHSSASLFKDVRAERIDSMIVQYYLRGTAGNGDVNFWRLTVDSGTTQAIREDIAAFVNRIRMLPDSCKVDGDIFFSRKRGVRDTNSISLLIFVNESEVWAIMADSFTFFRRSNSYWGIPLGKSVNYADNVYVDDPELYTRMKSLANRLITMHNQQFVADQLPLIP